MSNDRGLHASIHEIICIEVAVSRRCRCRRSLGFAGATAAAARRPARVVATTEDLAALAREVGGDG